VGRRAGILALGAITEVDGKIKAAGKTTLTIYLVRAVLDGGDFLGHPTRQSKVVYVTEQSSQTFIDALRRAGVHRREDELRIILREDLGDTAWPSLVTQTRIDGYDVVVFDTIGKLAGIVNENDAHEWRTAMAPLQDLSASGRAVLVDRHDRKGGGEVGESGRGSSQGSGDADIILQLRRPEGNQPSSRRVIETLSRYQQTPEKIVVELTANGYILLGGEEAVAQADALKFIRLLLAHELQTNPFPLSATDLIDQGRTERGLSAWSIRAALGTLVGLGELTVTGRGVKGSPHVYDRPPTPPPDAASPPSPKDSFATRSPGQTNEFPPVNGAPRQLHLRVPFPDVLPSKPA
jgi:hypothetical protein